MWVYEKKLEYPADVERINPRLAKEIIAQYGGPDGELGASLRYLTQRFTMPSNYGKALLTDIGTEELAHLEIIAALVYKLTDGASMEELKKYGFDDFYAIRDKAIFYTDPTGNPWTAAYIQAHGDPVADLHEDLAAEQKARATYEHLMDLTDDKKVWNTLAFLREREVIHFQRFGEALDKIQDELKCKKVF
ncbi:manganese catalase family protein [Calorimonas adulescens]|uniref:Manganese catalase family protein n=1 Tax=Calorimonas adulescens TaxID=2606906 RepID=A0A5D8QBY7_9THEO|nr:manganese catalase family protein [Calorimonas adulescens]MDI6601036.1 manganese catalase family protein [Thermoanaerobacteraceae bacterium]TZE81043.1 manganese catalase family protein [Calorimonas adulescens]